MLANSIIFQTENKEFELTFVKSAQKCNRAILKLLPENFNATNVETMFFKVFIIDLLLNKIE